MAHQIALIDDLDGTTITPGRGGTIAFSIGEPTSSPDASTHRSVPIETVLQRVLEWQAVAMDLYPTHEGRWVVRDTHSAPARAVITQLTQNGADLFRATEFHVVPAAAPRIGDFTTLSDAFDAVRTHTPASSRPPHHSPRPE